MSTILYKKSIIRKTLEVGGSTILSRLFGVAREFFFVWYLGVGKLPDAFLTAYKIPYSLRKIFAEGALSVAFIPTLVKMNKAGDSQQINSLMTLSFLIIEGLLIALCGVIAWKAEWVLRFIAPGWFVGGESITLFGLLPIPSAWAGGGVALEQVLYAITFLRILIFFIVFISSSALLACALQSVNHFFIPAISPVILNIVFIVGLVCGLIFRFSPEYLCLFIVLGGLVQFVLHGIAYAQYNFGFSPINSRAWLYFKEVLGKFFPCFFSMSVMEINSFLDTSFASYLPAGTISLIHYANRFMGIPLGVFAAAFSTILLPHFARIGVYAPRRLSFYLLESTKLVFWVTVPMSLMMGFFSEKIFHTIFYATQFSVAQMSQAGMILTAYVIGLCFFSLNKILLNIYYALHNTRIPAAISVVAVVVNVSLNLVCMRTFGAPGLALATTISGFLQTLLFVFFLHKVFRFKLYVATFATFLTRYIVQLVAVLLPSLAVYYGLTYAIAYSLPPVLGDFFLYKIGFWVWVSPLCLLIFAVLFMLRKRFGIQLYFLD